MDSVQGISGVKADRSFLLFGVFLDANAPTAAPPPTLDFRSTGLTPNFTTLAPTIGQVFYIGDGRTGTGNTGTVQTFQAPATATRLFLGIADGSFDGTKVFGSPGNYQDNGGSFTANFGIVPEPSSCALLVAIAGFLAARRKRSARGCAGSLDEG
jgi:hypothetical protein